MAPGYRRRPWRGRSTQLPDSQHHPPPVVRAGAGMEIGPVKVAARLSRVVVNLSHCCNASDPLQDTEGSGGTQVLRCMSRIRNCEGEFGLLEMALRSYGSWAGLVLVSHASVLRGEVTMANSRSSRVLLSTVSSDSHTWNLVYLGLLLEEHGYEVHNLGATVPDDLLIDTARSQRPDVIVMSSVNGHGYLDGSRVIRMLRATAGMPQIPAVIGGKLGIEGSDNDVYSQKLIEAGFDAVFGDQDASALLEALPDLIGSSMSLEAA